MLRFTGKEAIIYKNKYLVLSDLHLGIEKEFLLKGINIPSQTENLFKKILKLKENFNVENIIIVGDLKHNVPKISILELKEIPWFTENLSKVFKKIFIIKGNHDGDIEKIIPKKENIIICKELKIGNIVFTHGNRKPKYNGDLYIIGHHHFVLNITSSIGESFYEKVFVLGEYKDKKILILPAFSDIAGSWEVGTFHGPIAKKIEKYDVLSLDGIIISSK